MVAFLYEVLRAELRLKLSVDRLELFKRPLLFSDPKTFQPAIR